MEKVTPMMGQYLELKKEYKDCLLFFRLGDFYELFFEDALVASRELEITLTGRDCGQAERAPMCGVPHHSVDGYIARLVEKGFKVAICEQMENPKGLKTIVKREVVRVITPGTVIDSQMLDEGKNSYIMCIYQDTKGYGFALADITTGEFLTSSIRARDKVKDDDKAYDEKKLLDEIAKFMPREIITNNGFTSKEKVESVFNLKTSTYYEWSFNSSNANIKLCNHLKVINLFGYGLEGNLHAVSASGALLEYLTETQKNSLAHISTVKNYQIETGMVLDISSRKNLELTESMRDKNKKGSLLWVLDKTKTSMGARLLRKWIEQPITNPTEINKRLESVEELKDDLISREELRDILNTIHDIERLMGKVIYKNANARDLCCLKNSFEHLPTLKGLLLSRNSEVFREMNNAFDELSDLHKKISLTIIDEPPVSIKDGGLIRDYFNADLDRYREAKTKGTTWLLAVETREKESTGIKNLKVRYNKVFGYYIEVTNSYLNLVPDSYIRRQTLSNCERYTTTELKEIEEAILGADEHINELEYDIFVKLRDEIASQIERVQLMAYMIAGIDALQSLATVADSNNYVKPQINTSGIIEIKNGRHPVVEKLISQAFVPNDIYLDMKDSRLSIITGPNMAGKSTYMRQTALIVLMAQLGSFIPADSGNIGVVDRIFTRVGASDDLATGQSTFMVEMSEVANILHNASPNSLLILDEIGRGTSTFDGLSIAWSVLEYISKSIGAKTLFATHYHELTELEGKVSGVKNYCITVQEDGEEIVFLRKIALGGADNSYGIHVAKLAGIPEKVLKRSNEILAALNSADITKRTKVSKDATHTQTEPDIYYPPKKCSANKRILINELYELDVNALTFNELAKKINSLKSLAKDIAGEE